MGLLVAVLDGCISLPVVGLRLHMRFHVICSNSHHGVRSKAHVATQPARSEGHRSKAGKIAQCSARGVYAFAPRVVAQPSRGKVIDSVATQA